MRQQLETSSDDLLELVKENNKLAKEALEIAKKTRRSLRVMHWAGTAKFIIFIVIPLVLAVIYLPPLLSELNLKVSSLTGGTGILDSLKSLPALIGGKGSVPSTSSLPANIDPKLIEDFLKKQK